MILIIGYGNPLRSDDAIGHYAANMIQQRLRHTKLQVYTSYQLVPELANLISRAQLVIFIDALVGNELGKVFHERVSPDGHAGSLTHHVTPASLLAAARELYGNAPVGVLISITGARFDYGSELSPELQRKLPNIADQVKAIVESSANVQIFEENDHA